MAASTARSKFHTHVTPPRSAIRSLLIALGLMLPVGPALAQISCPMGIIGGNGQSALAGTRFSIPLTVGQTGSSIASPPTFDVSWSVTPGMPPLGNVYIEQSGTTNFTEPGVTWSAGPPFSYSASINVIAEPTANGVYTIQGSTPPCTSAFSTFNVNVFAPVVPQLNLFQGSGQSGVAGNPFPTQLGVVVSQGAPPAAAVPNAKVVYTILSGPAHFSNGLTSISTFTDGTGHALMDLFADTGITVATPVTVQVDSLGVQSGYGGIEVIPLGAVENLSASPSTTGLYKAIQGTDFADLFSISLTDGGGVPLPSVPVTFTLSGSTGARIFDGSIDRGTSFSTLSDGGGFASVNVRAGSPGSFSLTANTSNNTATWSLQTSPAGAQTLRIISGDGQITDRNTQFPAPLVLEALVNGSPTSGLPVQLTIISGSAYFLNNLSKGLLSPSQTTSVFIDNTLRASADIYAGTEAGDVVVEASTSGFSSVFYNLQVRAPDPDQVIKISGDRQQGSLNVPLGSPLVAGVTPAALVAANGAPLLFEVLSGSATFGPQGTPTYSAVPAGSELSAPATLILGNAPGEIQVRVSYPGMLPAVFTATAVAAGNGLQLLRTSGDGQIATTDLISDPLRVRLTEGSAGVADADIEWAVLSGNASLVNARTKTDANGDSETALQIGAASGSIVVRAMTQVAGGTSVLSSDFHLSAADAQLRAVAGSGQTGSIGSDADEVFVFELRRANGALLPGQTIDFFATRGATLTPTSAVTGGDGRASTGARYGNESGAVEVTARAFGGRVSAVGDASTFVPTLSIASGNNQTAGAGANLADPLVVVIARPAALRDKGLQGARVNWSVVSGGGSLTSAVTTTDSNGRSSNNLRLGQALGAQQIRAAIEGVGEVTFTANGTVPANSVLEIVSGNGQQIVPRRPSAPLVVRLRTADGTSLAGFTVRFTPSTNATVDPTDVVTGSDGRASTIANVTLPGDYTVTASLPALASVTPVVFSLGNGLANIPQLRPIANKVAQAIDRACPRLASLGNDLSAAQQDLLSRCSELVVNANANTSDVVNALDKMLADESSAQNNAALASATAQFENLKGRLAALRSGSQGANFGGLAIVTPSGRLPFSFLPSNLVLKAGDDDQAPQSDAGLSRWGFFATGTIGNGSRDPGEVDPGGDFDNYGLTAGVDYRVSDSLVVGAALGFNSNDSQLNQNQGDLESRGYSVSAYGSLFRGNNYYADAVLTMGRTSTDITRRINYTLPSLSGGTTTIDQVASGSPDSDQQSFALSVGKDFNRGAWSFGPYLRGTYTRLDFDGYIERMSNPSGPGAGLALEVDGRKLSSMQGVLGGKLSYVVSTSWGVLMPNLQIEYVKEFEDDSDGLVTRFAFDPTNSSIVINGDEIDSDFLNIGFGLSAVFANGRSGYLYYEHVAGKDRISQGSLALGVRIEF